MAYINTYHPPETSLPDYNALLDASIPWDFNFMYPVKTLQNDRIKLLPFVPSIFSQSLLELIKPNPELFAYLPWGPWRDMGDFLSFMHQFGHKKPDWVFFAVVDVTKDVHDMPWGDGALAGLVALLNTDPTNLLTEIGSIIIGKQFQRTHVTSNTVGLLLQWCFDDLKLRRVQWQANCRNGASVSAAKKMGFTLEGTIRWHRVLPKEKLDIGVGELFIRDGSEEDPGRHTSILSMSWDDWEGGLRESVSNRMVRNV